MIDNDWVRVDTDAVLARFREKQEKDALALVESCKHDEASLLVLKQAMEVAIIVHQEVIAGIDLALNAKQS